MIYDHSDYPNMIDYALNNLKTFEEDPVNEVDCLIFSWLVYINFHENNDIAYLKKGLPLKKLLMAEYFEEMFNKIWSPEETFVLLAICASSPRFRDVILRYYRNEISTDINLQFAAIVFSISDDYHVIVYRGTDWSITGWKEDALMALDNPIPAQKMAVSYLNEVSAVCGGRYAVAGHSKGGTVAVFASAHCSEEIQDRIDRIYSFDGPGFTKNELHHPGYLRIKDRIIKFVPQSSYFGYLFEDDSVLNVIYSNEISVMQHNPISWKVVDKSLFINQDKNPVSGAINNRIKAFVDSLDESQRRIAIQTIFDILRELNVGSIDEIMNDPAKYFISVIRIIKNMDEEHRTVVRQLIRLMMISKYVNKIDLSSINDVSIEFRDDDIDYDKYLSHFIR